MKRYKNCVNHGFCMYISVCRFFSIITGKMAEGNSILHLPVLPVFIKKLPCCKLWFISRTLVQGFSCFHVHWCMATARIFSGEFIKVHLTPKFFSTKMIKLISWSNFPQKFFNLVKSLIFYGLSKYVKTPPFWFTTESNRALVEGRMWRQIQNTVIL